MIGCTVSDFFIAEDLNTDIHYPNCSYRSVILQIYLQARQHYCLAVSSAVSTLAAIVLLRYRLGGDPSPSGGAAVHVLWLGDVVVKRRRPVVEPGDDVVRRQAAVALAQALDADVHDLLEHVVFLDEGLLHELLQRHPLKEPFGSVSNFVRRCH